MEKGERQRLGHVCTCNTVQSYHYSDNSRMKYDDTGAACGVGRTVRGWGMTTAKTH